MAINFVQQGTQGGSKAVKNTTLISCLMELSRTGFFMDPDERHFPPMII